MYDELDTIVLTQDMKDHGLRKGDLGTIVHSYADQDAYEMEFVAGDGKTVAVLTLTTVDIRPMARGEILHVRGPVATA